MGKYTVGNLFDALNYDPGPVTGSFLDYREQKYYRIIHYDKMKPFFMTLTSSDDHWLFISSTGGLTAGRTDADNSIFPYYTADKISENSENTGSRTIIRVALQGKPVIWIPFSDYYNGIYKIERNILKNIPGNSVIFQEVNHTFGLLYELEWTVSQRFGIIKRSRLSNTGKNTISLSLVDGVLNTLPSMVSARVQSELSNLLDAYKRNELIPSEQLGIFALSAALTDRAEPSESLRATTWWQRGLNDVKILLSDFQLNDFIHYGSVHQEEDIRARRGAYLIQTELVLEASENQEWFFGGEINQNHTRIYSLLDRLRQPVDLFIESVLKDIKAGTVKLNQIIGMNDGLQKTGNELISSHHYINVMFNLMRGGYFARGQVIELHDLKQFIKISNKKIYEKWHDIPLFRDQRISVWELHKAIRDYPDNDLRRLVLEYLPLTFSRRHGDPTRPWNKFFIKPGNSDGSPCIDYQGNWRDIFQNWEALLHSNPAFILSVIRKFLNAVTADGYNPYRISREGIDWERPEPDNPWSNIGYWSDHQIIYLEKLLELAEDYLPGELENILVNDDFVYANIPYEIKPYSSIKKDPKNTIYFNSEKDRQIEALCSKIGTDGRLLHNTSGALIHTNMAEKLLILLCAKLTNFVPGGGIWMNTQRPEWNDANNALVGNGLSVVTLSYLIRYTGHIRKLFETIKSEIPIHIELKDWVESIAGILISYKNLLKSGFTNKKRLSFMDEIGETGSRYRINLYRNGFSDTKTTIDSGFLENFVNISNSYFKDTLEANLREDGLYHSYNRLEFTRDEASVRYLYEMLEGQVAALSSGALKPEDAVLTLKALRASSIYRDDQKSYMLYPNRDLKKFIEKNTISASEIKGYPLAAAVASDKNNPVMDKDIEGNFHFKSTFKNAASIENAIRKYNDSTGVCNPLSRETKQQILDLFEKSFHHKDFTGRSGTFFAYEGLGSIYWHMVSKLLLAVQEQVNQAFDEGNTNLTEKLKDYYYHIRNGIGFNKSPDAYGAFPMDPYSHTPAGEGAKQPGMTGQVKEEIITRMEEVGIRVRKGQIHFTSLFINESEFLQTEKEWSFFDISGCKKHMKLPSGSFGFTFCQLPVIVRSGSPSIIISWRNGKLERLKSTTLNSDQSMHIFMQNGRIEKLEVFLEI